MSRKRITTIVAASAGIILLFLMFKPKHQEYSIDSAEVKRGKLVQEITASGTLQAVNTIAVGTQVTGIVAKIYADYNDHVKKDQLIAEIDKTLLRAALLDAQATVMRNEVQVEKTRKEWERDTVLIKNKAVSQVDSELAWFDYQTALGNLRSSQAQLVRSKTNLDYATITSPVKGVILSRNVDVGQTVVASFNTPTLFSIAQDLTKMQVLTDIDEADIGGVVEGQDAVFTVDAYPNIQFHGKVQQVRLNPKVTQDVVTYTVVIDVPNKDLKLMPGMTANVSIIVKEKENVLQAAQAALRFTPDASASKIKYPKFRNFKIKEESQQGGSHMLYEGMKCTVWKVQQDSVVPVLVTIGINDGNLYEITGNLNEGDRLVTEVKAGVVEVPRQGGKNPFMPQFPKRK